MVGGKTLGVGDHAGEQLKKVALEILQEHPAHFTSRSLAASLAMVVGDGANAMGGRLARHKSTASAELIWTEVFNSVWDGYPVPVMTDWGLMHREAWLQSNSCDIM